MALEDVLRSLAEHWDDVLSHLGADDRAELISLVCTITAGGDDATDAALDVTTLLLQSLPRDHPVRVATRSGVRLSPSAGPMLPADLQSLLSDLPALETSSAQQIWAQAQHRLLADEWLAELGEITHQQSDGTVMDLSRVVGHRSRVQTASSSERCSPRSTVAASPGRQVVRCTSQVGSAVSSDRMIGQIQEKLAAGSMPPLPAPNNGKLTDLSGVQSRAAPCEPDRSSGEPRCVVDPPQPALGEAARGRRDHQSGLDRPSRSRMGADPFRQLDADDVMDHRTGRTAHGGGVA